MELKASDLAAMLHASNVLGLTMLHAHLVDCALQLATAFPMQMLAIATHPNSKNHKKARAS